ncbi:MAG TPA: hypothetical protein VMP11_11020 [Verrucomicrobiae bacterium]|nr:hypothetical protein [Verrucomicrobiae bacterium]
MMSRRKYIIVAFTVAFLATIIGWSQTLIWKVFPTVLLVVWFPLVVFSDQVVGVPEVGLEVLLSLVQFPLLAICFVIGIRRWSPLSVAVAIMAIYALMVLAAWIILISHSAT